MSKRRINSSHRCSRCRLTPIWCICHKLVVGNTNVELTYIVHHRERHLSSNTVNLVQQTFPRSTKIQYYGQKDLPLDQKSIIYPNKINLYLFPDPQAAPFSIYLRNHQLKSNQINLIIPDGTWGQARKIKRRNSFLSEVQSVKITNPPSTQYQLRQQSNSSHLCTLEATAYALGEIESSPVNQELLLKNLEFFNRNTLLARNAHLLNYMDKY